MLIKLQMRMLIDLQSKMVLIVAYLFFLVNTLFNFYERAISTFRYGIILSQIITKRDNLSLYRLTIITVKLQ